MASIVGVAIPSVIIPDPASGPVRTDPAESMKRLETLGFLMIPLTACERLMLCLITAPLRAYIKLCGLLDRMGPRAGSAWMGKRITNIRVGSLDSLPGRYARTTKPPILHENRFNLKQIWQ